MRKLVLMILFIYNLSLQAATPVVDYVAIEKILLMLSELEDHYKKMEEQLVEAKLHTGLLSGKNLFSDTYNTDKDKNAREWAPDSIEDFEDMINLGFNPGDLADRYEYYQYKFPSIDPATIDTKNPNSPHNSC